MLITLLPQNGIGNYSAPNHINYRAGCARARSSFSTTTPNYSARARHSQRQTERDCRHGDVGFPMVMALLMLAMRWGDAHGDDGDDDDADGVGDVGKQLRWVIIACSYSVARSAGRRGPEDLSCSRATEICAAAKKPARPLIQSTQLRPRAPATTWRGWKLAPQYRTG